MRVRSGRHVAAEVRLLQGRYGIKEMCFYDDTFTAARREVQAFCTAVREMRLDLTWSCFSRIDTFDEEAFRIMKQSGCHQVMYGVENCCRDILENLNKRLPLDRVETVIRATQRLGLRFRTAFMLGSPGETEQTLEETSALPFVSIRIWRFSTSPPLFRARRCIAGPTRTAISGHQELGRIRFRSR